MEIFKDFLEVLIMLECIVFELDVWNQIVVFSILLLLGKRKPSKNQNTPNYLVS